jgi:ferredoxin
MIAKVEVDKRTCIGCGTCWVSCPGTFREVEEGDEYKAAATDVLAPEDQLRRAAGECPSLSIALIDVVGVVVFPTEAQREELRRQQQW